MGRLVIPHGNRHTISPSTDKQEHNSTFLKYILGQVTSVQRDKDVKVSEK